MAAIVSKVHEKAELPRVTNADLEKLLATTCAPSSHVIV